MFPQQAYLHAHMHKMMPLKNVQNIWASILHMHIAELELPRGHASYAPC